MSAAQPRKWTKADITRLCDQIKSFYIINRPLDYRGMEAFNIRWRQALAEKLLLIVMTGLEGWLTMVKERVAKTLAHDAYVLSRLDIWPVKANPSRSDLELAARQAKYKADELKDVAICERLIARIQAEGLPSEVLAYDPSIEARK